ncbi:MAG: EamA family transporter, partial [Anaerolineaceae bacterium]|nr:EamA family transporter [Anaerolineaceae bacterium]
PVSLAAAGVLYLTISLGKLPWIALILALSFGLYGLMKKIAPLGSLQGLTLETGAVFLPALGILLFAEATGKGVYGHTDLPTTILLSLVGIVTAVPLLFFATGARRVPLSTMGLLQYVSPTIQFFIGVFLFGEPFSHQRLIGFSMIWIALAIFTAESLLHRSDKPMIPDISDPPIPVEPPV